MSKLLAELQTPKYLKHFKEIAFTSELDKHDHSHGDLYKNERISIEVCPAGHFFTVARDKDAMFLINCQ